jgi:hypothetical protein
VKTVEANVQRRKKTRQGCAHLRVNIRAIVRPWDPERAVRTVGGICQDCGGEVEREITEREIMLGRPQTRMEARVNDTPINRREFYRRPEDRDQFFARVMRDVGQPPFVRSEMARVSGSSTREFSFLPAVVALPGATRSDQMKGTE